MSYNIGFDIAHKERGIIDQNYNEVRDFLNSNNFICYNFLETPIDQKKLKPYDILVFACPDFAKISRREIMEIEKWVTQDGGGLLLSHAGGDRGRSTNLSELSQRFGIVFENDQVLDETTNLMEIENLPVTSNFIPPHPITAGIKGICYRAGCSLSVVGDAFSIALSNETSEPFSCPLICVAQPGNGRVCAIGSYEMFRSKIGGGFQYEEHSKLVLNIFNWLISDYRMELETREEIVAPEARSVEEVAEPIEEQPVFSDSSETDTTLSEAARVKVASSKSELIELLRNFLSQINNMKQTIESLIGSISESDILSAEIAPETTEFIELADQEDTNLSELPAKPNELQKEIADELTKLPPMPEIPKSSSQVPDEMPIDVVEQPSKEIPNQEGLESELETIENKLKSISNLLSFIEKKYKDGKLSGKSYKKQKSTLEKDIETSNRRIKEIKKLLEEF